MLGMNRKEAPLAKKEEETEATLAPVDVFENDKEFLLVADLPGVPQGGADVTLERNRLIVQAAAQSRKYRRELIVPSTVDAEGVEAQMRSGVLTVRLPKRAEQQPRQIAVRGG
jgi:HSP20 family molecular chaperone IbpA